MLKIQRVDRLYIDTEGYDCQIISAINFDKMDIPYVEYEHVHSDGLHLFGEKGICTQNLLKSHGYTLTDRPPFNTVAAK